MKNLFLLSIIAIFASASISISGETVDSKGNVNTPIHVTVKPALTPNVTVNLPKDGIEWKVAQLIVTLIGIVIAAGMIMWQMNRQHDSALALQKETAREALHANLYEKLQHAISVAETAVVEASSYARMIPFHLRNYRSQVELGIPNSPGLPIVRQRAPKFGDLHQQMYSAVVELISIFESYAIAVPDFIIFQHALNSALHDAREAHLPLHREVIPLLPTDLSDRVPPDSQNPHLRRYHIPPPPSDEQLAQLQSHVDAYLRATDHIGCYITDLRVESQNTLLKNLYPDQRAPRRNPIDPNYKVITVENAEELTRYFLEETPWGEMKQATDASVRAEMAATET